MKARRGFTRREVLRLGAAGVAGIAGGAAGLSCLDVPTSSSDPSARAALHQPHALLAAAATLSAVAGSASVGGDELFPAWLFNHALPGPTLRARRGSQAQVTLYNGLPEPTIVHWHGLLVPELADGHPRNAIAPGTQYQYDYPIVQRAGTYWYHPHAHHLTAGQIHRGMAGFFIVSDDEEDALELPAGSREVLLMLQDRASGAGNPLGYTRSETDHLAGFLGDVPFGNGVRLPRLQVTADRYRLRVLNASQARVYLLGRSDGAPMTVIGSDGGLLASAVLVDSVFLGVGERVDLLLDLTGMSRGDRLMLKSLPFAAPAIGGERLPQGAELDLLELVATGPGQGNDSPLPPILSTLDRLDPGAAVRTREFVFSSVSQGAEHQINGTSFVMDRIDAQVALGDIERWRLINDSSLPHPVHLHGTQFQVVARTGGRNLVYPYEMGWKDTVLMMPLETIDILVRYDWYRGLFPMHCHNLQHEDMGMMLNIEVT